MEMINANSKIGDQVILEKNGHGEVTAYGTICSIDENYTHPAYTMRYKGQKFIKFFVNVEYHINPRFIKGQFKPVFSLTTGKKMSF